MVSRQILDSFRSELLTAFTPDLRSRCMKHIKSIQLIGIVIAMDETHYTAD
jgi:hypothetical protein